MSNEPATENKTTIEAVGLNPIHTAPRSMVRLSELGKTELLALGWVDHLALYGDQVGEAIALIEYGEPRGFEFTILWPDKTQFAYGSRHLELVSGPRPIEESGPPTAIGMPGELVS